MTASLRELAPIATCLGPRNELGDQTLVELDTLAPRADHVVCRDRFYEEVRSDLERSPLGTRNSGARRMAQRDAVCRPQRWDHRRYAARARRTIPFAPRQHSASWLQERAAAAPSTTPARPRAP